MEIRPNPILITAESRSEEGTERIEGKGLWADTFVYSPYIPEYPSYGINSLFYIIPTRNLTKAIKKAPWKKVG